MSIMESGNDTTGDFCKSGTTNSENDANYMFVSNLKKGQAVINIQTIVPLFVALPCYGYLIPILVLITVVTNSFIVLVLSDKTLRTTTNRILLSMTVMATLTSLSCLPWFLYYYTFKGYEEDTLNGMPKTWCMLHRILSEIMPRACHTATTWLTVLLSMRRYCVVSNTVPGTTKGRVPVKIPILLICTVAAIVELPIIFSRKTISIKAYNRSFCVQELAPWVMEIGPRTFFITHGWLSVFFVHAGPCVLLVTYMLLLIRFIRRRQAKHRRNSSLRRCRTAVSNVKMLVILLCIFLATEIPAVVIYIMHILQMTFTTVPSNRYHAMNIALILRNVFIVASCPFNLSVYLLMSQQFRNVSVDFCKRIWASVAAIRFYCFSCCCLSTKTWYGNDRGGYKSEWTNFQPGPTFG